MKRKITFLLAALLLMSGLTWAQQITWSAADQGYENAQVIESVDFDDFVTGAFFKGTNNNAPKYYNTGAAIRCYGGNYFTITSDYILTEIVLGFASGEGTNAITTSVGSYENGTWTGSANEVTFTINGTSGHRRIASFTITYDEGGTPTPSITASNVSLTYDATEGFITYAINNEPSPAGELSADVTEGTWLNVGTINDTTVQVTCSANEAASSREGVITLTYTYGDSETVTKDVTVTQEGAPVAYTTIPELFAAATSTGTDVLVNFNNWVVSGVSTNGKNVFVTDNESNGLVIFDNNGGLGDIYTVGDILSGETSCTLKLYNGFAELLNVNAEDLTITEGGSITEATVAMADLTGVNTGALLHYENLTCSVNNNKYYLTDGTTSLQVYNALYAFEALENGKVYNITGIYQQYNSTKEILPRSADDIEEVVPTDPFIDAENVALTYDATEGAIAYTINNPVDGGSIAASVESEWLYVDEEAQYTAEGSFTLLCDPNTGDARTATVTLTYTYGEANVTKDVTVTQAAAPQPSLTVTPATVNAPVEGADGTLAITYENIPELISFDYYFCDAEGNELQETPDWIDAEIQEENENYSVYYIIDANEGEARTAYFKVYTLVGDEEVYSMVTINQAAYVAPTYATLPFEFNGGKADIESTDGLYQEGLGSDYGSAPKLKFDGTGDWLLLQFQEEPGTLTFDIKGNSFSGGTFTVQTSVDGETYTDLAAYTELGATETVTIALNGNVRYIKWIYTEKVSGNVGLGNIALIAPVPAITLEQYAINVEATSGDGMISVVYTNMDELYLDPHVQLYDAEGTPVDPEYYDWISVNIGYLDDNVYYGYDANTTTEARTVYFKVYNDEVYSELATITQAGIVAPASITVTPETMDLDAEQHYIANESAFTVNYENIEVTNYQSFTIHYYDVEGEEIQLGDDTWHVLGVIGTNDEGYQVVGYVMANEGEARTSYFKVSALDINGNTVYSNLATINQAAYVPVTTESWVLTDLADLTENDVFVIVGTDEFGGIYAMTNDNGNSSAPAAVGVTIVDEVLQQPATNIQWNLSITDNGYIFYPNGNAESWLYCNTTASSGSNNNMRVGDGARNIFSFDENGYMVTDDEYETRYLSVYNGQDWRGYVNTNNNPVAITFYKKVGEPSITVEPATVNVDIYGYQDILTVTYSNITYINAEVYLCDAEGAPATYDWITAYVYYSDYQVGYEIEANHGDARTAYLKVHALDDNGNDVYSNLVTINQDAYVGASITVETTEVNATAAATTGTFNVTGINVDMDYTWVEFCTVDGGYAYYDWVDAEVINEGENYYISYTIEANGGAARTAYFKVGGQDNVFQDLVYSDIVAVHQEAYQATVAWVRTDFADLMEGDRFVIVGTRTDAYAGDYAMPNDGSYAPTAVAVRVENDALFHEPDVNLQWFLGNTEDGYVFYPVSYSYSEYFDNEYVDYPYDYPEAFSWWLYCNDANNGMRVGYGDNKAFVMEDGYLKNVATSRYVGIYNAQDWRCYQNTTGNIANQTFAFYKKVVEPVTCTLEINGYGESTTDGYYLIASPVFVNPETTGMTQGNFDLYWFDQTQQNQEWRNYEAENGHFNLVPGKGYLYANSQDVTLTFTGTPYEGSGTFNLVKNDDSYLPGINLVGNPFTVDAQIDNNHDCYSLNEAGNEVCVLYPYTDNIHPMQGVFVYAVNAGEEVTFYAINEEPGSGWGKGMAFNVSGNTGKVIDRAIVRFGEGRQLPKFQLNENSTKLYIPQGNNDYSVVRSAAQGEMPMNFKAAQEGTYTLSINTENVEMNYLHLIDNMTGADIDLLQTPSYTFESNTNDYSNRFRLVFSANDVEENFASDSFAYFNGSEWVISNTGKATLQMVDLTGRILSSESISGNATVSTSNLSTGVYMMRLINGSDVKIQKMVVK